MKRSIVTLLLCVFPVLVAAKPQFGEMVPICMVSFTAKTQMGEIPCQVAVCRLESAMGTGSSLYVVTAYDREYSPRIERILEVAHSPIIEKRGDRIVVLFTGGANTTLVAVFSTEKGLLEYLSEEVIAWNDRGTYRTSASFAQYSELLRRRNERNQALQRNAGSRPSSGDSSASEIPSSLGPRG
jgi:hypothetical protein